MKRFLAVLIFVCGISNFSKAQIVANFKASRDTICINLNDTFTDLHTGGASAVYSLYFDDGNSATGFGVNPSTYVHAYAAAGVYHVKYTLSTVNPITYAAGTYDTITKTIVVLNYPDASFTFTNIPGCLTGRDTLKLLNKVGNVTYTLNYGTASPMGAPPANGGPYPMTLPSVGNAWQHLYFSMTASGFGCTSPNHYDSLPVQYCSPPTAQYLVQDSFGNPVTTFCNCTGYTFVDNTIHSGAPIISWSWNFNDAPSNTVQPVPYSTATTQGPHIITFPAAGYSYNVTLTVTDANGLTNTSPAHYIHPNGCCHNPFYFKALLNPPVSNTPCLGDSSLFSDVSVGSPANWIWKWGDGTKNDSVPFAYHTWHTAGTFKVEMLAQDVYGAWDSAFYPITVGAAPNNSAGRDTLVCFGSQVNIGSATQANSVYAWTSMPTGYNSSSASNAVHPLVTTTYFLAASNLAGTCFTHDTVAITVDVPPTVTISASADSLCINTPDTITLSPNNLPHYTLNYNGGGVIGSPPNNGPFSVSWTTLGAKAITGTATTSHGCVATVIPKTIKIIPCNPAQALFYPPTTGLCTNTPVLFYDSSKNNPTSWYWTFGSGASPAQTSQRNPTVVFYSAGKHKIKLTACNSGGCTDYYDSVMVYVAPTSTFDTVSPVCLNYNTILKYTGNASSSAVFNWNFNGGIPLFLGAGNDSIKVRWTSPGRKYVSLQVMENSCPSNINNATVFVSYPPVAKFSHTILPGAYVTFINQSQNSSSWNWSFGNGSNSSAFNPPVVVYHPNGTYLVTLTAMLKECANSDSLYLNITNALGVEDVVQSAFGFYVQHDDAKQQLNLYWKNDAAISKKIVLYNINGEMIFSKENCKENLLQINTSDFSSGLYLAKVIYIDGTTENRKWVKAQQ